jgi:hypothetical protein
MKTTLSLLNRKIIVLFACSFLLLELDANSQIAIGGIINTYTPVTSINNCTCPTTNCNQITVGSSSGFTIGDKIMMFQAKGARVDTSNTAAHGSILNLYDAGNYEFATIYSISGNVITTNNPLKETYFSNSNPADSAYVQMIRVPVYVGNVNVTSTLTPQAWSAATGTGGVLVFEASGTVTLSANISADGYGFNGAKKLQVATACDMDTAFYYQSTAWNYASCTGCGYVYDDAATRRVGQVAYGGCGTTCYTNRMSINDIKSGGYRGEGIAANTFKKTFANGNVSYFDKGRGRWGNGGGGGGNHNGGGGGGSNYGAGGFGGKMYNSSSTACPTVDFASRRGYGGATLTPTAAKIFMGGGGGEGHDNGGNGNTGVAGGGIIIISAASITSAGIYTISAKGTDNTFVAFGDGSGGGGAVGTVLLDIPSFANPITVSVEGGNGGSHNNNNCHGTGGGGGGGVIWFSPSSLPSNVTADISGGTNGVQVAGTLDCSDINWGATAGGSGLINYGLASGASGFINMCSCETTPLPVELVSFTGTVIKDKVELKWTTSSEKNNNYFIVEKSSDSKLFSEVVKIKGAGNSTVVLYYHAIDYEPSQGTSYYRLKQVNYDGEISYSKWVDVNVQHTYAIKAIPNPSTGIMKINLPETPSASCRVHIKDASGKSIYEWIIPDDKFNNSIALTDVNFGASGLYYLLVEMDGTIYREKIRVEHD